MITIIDYGMGNPGSILNMIRKVGGQAVIAADEESIQASTALILPGVGSYDNGVEKLKATGLWSLINQRVLEQEVPFLGICLGMQLLFNGSEEGELEGLGWIDGTVRRFSFSEIADCRLKVPHMGWNLVSAGEYESLFSGLEAEARFYFVHSFHAQCDNPSHSLGTTHYGYDFTSAVHSKKIYGVQFHPEKSHRFGMSLMRNFLRIVDAC